MFHETIVFRKMYCSFTSTMAEKLSEVVALPRGRSGDTRVYFGRRTRLWPIKVNPSSESEMQTTSLNLDAGGAEELERVHNEE